MLPPSPTSNSRCGRNAAVRVIMLYHIKSWTAAARNNPSRLILSLLAFCTYTLWWCSTIAAVDYMPIAFLCAVISITQIMQIFRFPQLLCPIDLQHIAVVPLSNRKKWMCYFSIDTATFIAMPAIILIMSSVHGINILLMINIILTYVCCTMLFESARLTWSRNIKLAKIIGLTWPLGIAFTIPFSGHIGERSFFINFVSSCNALYMQHELHTCTALAAMTIISAIISIRAFRHICATYPFRKPELMQRLKRKS